MKIKNVNEMSIDERLARLEHQNFVLKFILSFVFLLILVTGIVSWRFQDTEEPPKTNDKVLHVKEILLEDPKSNEYIKINNSRIEFVDKKQNSTTKMDSKTLEISNKGKVVLSPTYFSFYREYEKGEIAAATFYPIVPEWTFYDPKGSGRFIINLNRFGIYYFDPTKRSSISFGTRGINYFNGENQKEYSWP
jgi:hypothetical protein